MKFDAKFAHILSDFFLDIAKAVFIGTFITPALSKASSELEFAILLTRGLSLVIIFLLISWEFSKLEHYV